MRKNSAGFKNIAIFMTTAIKGYGSNPRKAIKAVGQIMIKKNQAVTETVKAFHLELAIVPKKRPRIRKAIIRRSENIYISISHFIDSGIPAVNPINMLIPKLKVNKID
jgi:hypothetical protein